MIEDVLTHRLKALSNPTRLKILRIVSKAGRLGTSDIEEAFGADNGGSPIPAMWFHIHALQRAGLLKSFRDGIALRLEIDHDAVETVIICLRRLIANEAGMEYNGALVGDATQTAAEAVRVPEAAIL